MSHENKPVNEEVEVELEEMEDGSDIIELTDEFERRWLQK